MFAITGITGQVGGVVARTLLEAGRGVRAVVRDAGKGEAWTRQGCEVARAEMSDAAALRRAFEGTEGVFMLLPPNFSPSPGFPETRRIIDAVDAALRAAKPAKLVCLSTIGAQAEPENLLTQLQLMEQCLGELPCPVAFLRAAWFMENCAWDVAPARETGVIPSFLQPLDRAWPMVATGDVGRVAAELVQQTWSGRRVIELEGPARVSPNDIAAEFSALLGKPVRTEAVPRDTWAALFDGQGMSNSQPRIRMLDGFNEGWLRFEPEGSAGIERQRGRIPLRAVLQGLLAR